MVRIVGILALLVASFWAVSSRADNRLRLATFHADVTPPIGSPLCDALVEPAREIVDRLSARGIVLLGAGRPIVLCAVDWVGIGNLGHTAWTAALAEAAETTPDRVAIHSLHQHDAPGCDFSAETLLAEYRLAGRLFNVAHARQAIADTAHAVKKSIPGARAITHVGLGKALVKEVAANRRILGPDGKVQYVRYSSCKDERIRAFPEGVIDPHVRLVSFWSNDRPVAALSYYATHPQSYYGRGGVSADFVGMARSLQEKENPDVVYVHFNGAGGNVAAGKYNDGSPGMRPVLARRLADGMKAAWESTQKTPIRLTDLEWRTQRVVLPLRSNLVAGRLRKTLADDKAELRDRLRAARDLAWTERVLADDPITLSCLRIRSAYVVHLPGELFVEYQIFAQAVRPDDFVAVAAYGDYGPGYIGTRLAYYQGGYETSQVSRTAPDVEPVLLDAIRLVLK
jgi:hypothetical protein